MPAAPDTFSGVGQRMVQADVTSNNGVNAKAVTDAFAAHGMTLAAPVTSLPVPLGKAKRGGAAGELRERLGVPQGTKVTVNEVESDTHGTIGHVTAYRAVPLDSEGLQGVNIMVPGVARVQMARRGGAITGVLGEVSPATGDAERQARAFARTLIASGDISVSARATRGRRIAPPPAIAPPKRTASHEIRIRRRRADDRPGRVLTPELNPRSRRPGPPGGGPDGRNTGRPCRSRRRSSGRRGRRPAPSA